MPDTGRSPALEDRVATGRAARERRPRGSLARWHVPDGRVDPVGRLAPTEDERMGVLLPVRHHRMAGTPLAFLRGAATVMAADLAAGPSTELLVRLCGDAHLGNFGVFAGPDGRLVFDLADYAEALTGPFEWDVLRLATSFVLAGREGAAGVDAATQAARVAARSYRHTMRESAGRPELSLFYPRDDSDELTHWVRREPKSARRAGQVTIGAGGSVRRFASSAVERFTHADQGARRIVDEPPALLRIGTEGELADAVGEVFAAYRTGLAEERELLLDRYVVVDVGHKVVGVGSVGLVDLVVLLQGLRPRDLIVLQVRQAQDSALTPFLPETPPAYPSNAERVVASARLSQRDVDAFLGAADRAGGPSCYVRQLRDCAWAPIPTALDRRRIVDYARLCGQALARAHARSGDPVAVAAYLGGSARFENAVGRFARRYAHQVVDDHAAYRAALGSAALPDARTIDREQLVEGLRTALVRPLPGG